MGALTLPSWPAWHAWQACLAPLALGLALAWPAGACAQALGAVRESALRAAFVYKFTGFVEWPPGAFARPDEPLVIGVAGDEELAAELEQAVAGRSADGRPLAVRRLREVEGAAGLHVLVLAPAREARVREAVQSTPGAVLVVTQQDGGLRLGGVLNLTAEGGRLRFSASLTAAEARSLRLSARLLALAQTVEGRSR